MLGGVGLANGATPLKVLLESNTQGYVLARVQHSPEQVEFVVWRIERLPTDQCFYCFNGSYHSGLPAAMEAFYRRIAP